MAVYNNREVAVMGPTRRPNPPSTIVVQYGDGSHETVSIGKVRFTDAEKKALIKAHPSEYDGVNVISEDDVKAVRAGVAPASDPDRKIQAEGEVRTDEARKLDKVNQDKAKEEAKKQPKPTPATPSGALTNRPL